jgi:signal peptide peptidase SppA
MRDSIFISSIRSFMITLFGTAGLMAGIFGMIILFALFGSMSTVTDGAPEITYKYSPEIAANGDGIRKDMPSDTPIILKIDITGIIGLDDLTKQAIELQLVESRERSLKDRVKAILLNINTPGGTVDDANGIYLALKHYKETYKVPVYAYVNGLAASGGMYVACAADKIYANDASIVGSVGVILATMLNFSEVLDKFGIKTMTLYDGKGKDNLNPLRPWKAGEEDNIKSIMNAYYKTFVDIVTSNRPRLDKAKLIDVYGADIYIASVAKEFGYVDEVGVSLEDVIKELAKKIDIKDDNYQVIALTNESWISQLFKGYFGTSFGLLSGTITHKIELGAFDHPKLSGQYLYLYRPQ